jgi:hypothetical protein
MLSSLPSHLSTNIFSLFPRLPPFQMDSMVSHLPASPCTHIPSLHFTCIFPLHSHSLSLTHLLLQTSLSILHTHTQIPPSPNTQPSNPTALIFSTHLRHPPPPNSLLRVLHLLQTSSLHLIITITSKKHLISIPRSYLLY